MWTALKIGLFAPVRAPRLTVDALGKRCFYIESYLQICANRRINASCDTNRRRSAVYDPSRAIISGNYELSARVLWSVRSCRDNGADNAGYMYLPDTGDVCARSMHRADSLVATPARRRSRNASESAVRLRDMKRERLLNVFSDARERESNL